MQRKVSGLIAAPAAGINLSLVCWDSHLTLAWFNPGDVIPAMGGASRHHLCSAHLDPVSSSCIPSWLNGTGNIYMQEEYGSGMVGHSGGTGFSFHLVRERGTGFFVQEPLISN